MHAAEPKQSKAIQPPFLDPHRLYPADRVRMNRVWDNPTNLFLRNLPFQARQRKVKLTVYDHFRLMPSNAFKLPIDAESEHHAFLGLFAAAVPLSETVSITLRLGLLVPRSSQDLLPHLPALNLEHGAVFTQAVQAHPAALDVHVLKGPQRFDPLGSDACCVREVERREPER